MASLLNAVRGLGSGGGGSVAEASAEKGSEKGSVGVDSKSIEEVNVDELGHGELNFEEDTAGGMGRHLGVFSCTLLIVGRIIGTGIFSTPSSILGSVGSVGASLMLWVLGFVLSFCGLFVWLEYGTMIPKSGGEKVYLEAVYTKPKYFATVIFAANAILLGFTASGCIQLGIGLCAEVCQFLQVLGDNFSCHAVSNPDMESERRLLAQLAPELDDDLLRRLVGAFHDLRKGYDDGSLTYPYSLRELIALVRHMRAYPTDTLDNALRNVFDFDVYKQETIDKLAEILQHHGLKVQHLGLDASRESAAKKVLDMKFEPRETGLDKPKRGKDDPKDEPHQGGNTFSGGTGGRDTAGMGGRGGYMRLFKGGDIQQVIPLPTALCDPVLMCLDEIKEQAREMARQELARRLEELNMSAIEAKGYGALLTAVQSHIAPLHDLLEHLAAKEEERVWIKRQTDGELDDSRLTEGLTGEATVYKRRGMAKPEIGRPQIKPKRIRFLFDVSGSMYRFQYDGRLQRTLETAVMLMESFNRLQRKDKYVWDMYGHSGDSPEIPLVTVGQPITEVSQRWAVAEKMNLITQYAFAGDFTVEALEKAAIEVSKFDGDDHFVIAISDANFSRYGITGDDLQRAMNRHPKVKTALICIGEGAEAAWIPKQFPGRGFRVANTADIPKVLRSILSSMVDR
ncbi:hypothetical protein EWM64_g8582 [Hericium alpestre]|uniref:VWFA domain-containing protein n=1 Tax=Hericium alpestre TaxID=135208 RepID=A0A4Y9ZMF3_9AGAM|nr:hypothetical protein EWM64_g8582 [Hericium alpestre]